MLLTLYLILACCMTCIDHCTFSSIEKLPVGVSTYARSALAPRLARSLPFVQPGVFRSYLSTEHISLNYLLFLSLDSTVDSSVPEGTVKFIIQT